MHGLEMIHGEGSLSANKTCRWTWLADCRALGRSGASIHFATLLMNSCSFYCKDDGFYWRKILKARSRRWRRLNSLATGKSARLTTLLGRKSRVRTMGCRVLALSCGPVRHQIFVNMFNYLGFMVPRVLFDRQGIKLLHAIYFNFINVQTIFSSDVMRINLAGLVRFALAFNHLGIKTAYFYLLIGAIRDRKYFNWLSE